MFAKIHETGKGKVLACCEKELIGKTIEEGNIFFEVKERFYKQKEVKEEELKEMMKECESVNLLGKKPVSVAEKQGIISKKDIKLIQGIPHIQIYKV